MFEGSTYLWTHFIQPAASSAPATIPAPSSPVAASSLTSTPPAQPCSDLGRAASSAGFALAKHEDWTRALERYDRAIAEGCDSDVLRSTRGYALFKAGRQDEAAADLEKVRLGGGDDGWASYNLALVRQAQDREREAVDAISAAVRLDPKLGPIARADTQFTDLARFGAFELATSTRTDLSPTHRIVAPEGSLGFNLRLHPPNKTDHHGAPADDEVFGVICAVVNGQAVEKLAGGSSQWVHIATLCEGVRVVGYMTASFAGNPSLAAESKAR